MTSGPAYYVEPTTDRWGNPVWAVMDGFTKKVLTTKLTQAAAEDAVDRLYENDRNYKGAEDAGLDMTDL